MNAHEPQPRAQGGHGKVFESELTLSVPMADTPEPPASTPETPAGDASPPATDRKDTSPSKEQVSAALNELLGVKVMWTRLSSSDLTQLVNLFDNPKVVIERLIPNAASVMMKEVQSDRPLLDAVLNTVPMPFGIVRRRIQLLRETAGALQQGGGLL